MRRAARIDSNHAEIVSALERVGASVHSLASTGSGVPDILAGLRGKNYLLEVKDGRRPPSERRLTPAQVEWHSQWRGSVVVVESVAQALEAVEVRAA